MNIQLKQSAKFRSDSSGGNGAPLRYPVVMDENTVIHFPEGIPAFEDSKRFSVILNENIMPFMYMRSLDVNGLGFVCVDPFLVYPEYSALLPPKYVSALQLKTPADALPLCLVTITSDPKETTANLMAPVIINVQSMLGFQIILENYPVRYNIWKALEKMDRRVLKDKEA